MWTTLAPALVAAAAALGGVTVGALVEPLKLAAAQRARGRQDRAERCARLIEAAMGCRARLLALNLVHRRVVEGLTSNEELLDEHLEQYRQVRAELRQVVALLRLNGPDTLVEAALRVREAERALRATRFTCDDGGRFNADVPPQSVLDVAHALEAVTHEFAAIAQKLA